jgi:predicted dinucleotide-binding enzyme
MTARASRSGQYDRRMTTIGILGGTGSQGRGLARRFAQAGHVVVIGCEPDCDQSAVPDRAGIMITDLS